MIVFDLQCSAHHVFEAWFSSSDAYEAQRKQGQLICPICSDVRISKAVMAPNVGAKGNAARGAQPETLTALKPGPDVAPEAKALLAALAKAQAKALKSSKWVGRDFDRKARAMDAGEEASAAIHGQATPDEARALMEDGIGVMPLLVPVVPPEELN